MPTQILNDGFTTSVIKGTGARVHRFTHLLIHLGHYASVPRHHTRVTYSKAATSGRREKITPVSTPICKQMSDPEDSSRGPLTLQSAFTQINGLANRKKAFYEIKCNKKSEEKKSVFQNLYTTISKSVVPKCINLVVFYYVRFLLC